LSGSPLIVGVVDAVVTGVLAAVVGQAMGAGHTARTVIGVVAAVVLGTSGYRKVHRVSRDYQAVFPR
jgi:hypothetical protein